MNFTYSLYVLANNKQFLIKRDNINFPSKNRRVYSLITQKMNFHQNEFPTRRINLSEINL